MPTLEDGDLTISESGAIVQYVLARHGNGRLAPRDVELGARAGDYFVVLAGLKPGEVVVTSGNFLVAAESKLKSATQKW